MPTGGLKRVSGKFISRHSTFRHETKARETNGGNKQERIADRQHVTRERARCARVSTPTNQSLEISSSSKQALSHPGRAEPGRRRVLRPGDVPRDSQACVNLARKEKSLGLVGDPSQAIWGKLMGKGEHHVPLVPRGFWLFWLVEREKKRGGVV